MAQHIEKSTTKQTSESRRRTEDECAEEGRELWRAAVESTEENSEGRQDLQDESDTVLDEIDEILEANALVVDEAASAQQRRRADAEHGGDRPDVAITTGLGSVVLLDNVIHNIAA